MDHQSSVYLNERRVEISAIKLEVEKLYAEGGKMDVCSQHYLPNNKYGRCPECEAAPDIRTLHCKKCNTLYKEHKPWDNDGLCEKCAVEYVMDIVCKAG